MLSKKKGALKRDGSKYFFRVFKLDEISVDLLLSFWQVNPAHEFILSRKRRHSKTKFIEHVTSSHLVLMSA